MKKLSALIICLLMIITCGLAGCAGFEINKVKYYNEVLAKVGDKNITRFEVLNAYNSYGNTYYVQQMGQSEKQAIKSTLNLLIDREEIYQYALSDAKYKPTSYQVNAIIEEMYESLDEQMEEYVSTAKKMLNIKTTEEETEEAAEDSKVYKYSDYIYETNRRAELVSSKTFYTDESKTTISSTPTEWFEITGYEIKYDLPEQDNYTAIISESALTNFNNKDTLEEIQTTYFSKQGRFYKSLVNSEKLNNVEALYNKAVALFVNDLIDYEYYLRDNKGNEYNKKTNDLIHRYIERTFESQIQSQYLENVRTDYLNNNAPSIELIMEEFDKKITSSYAQYVNRPSAYKKAMKDIGTNGDTILYHLDLCDAEDYDSGKNTKFGYFIHTLLSFSDTQKTDIKNLDKDDIDYQSDYQDIVGSTVVKARNNNGVEDKEETLNEVLEKYQQIASMPNNADRRNAFIQFMFKYTGDTATLTSGMPYVVGTNGFSSMVEEFTNESIALMEKGAGSMSEIQVNNIGSYCITEYGIHLVMYIDDVNAYDFDYSAKNSVQIQNLTKTLNPLTGETYFDMLFDAVYPASGDEEVYTSNNGYTNFEKGIIEDMKAVNKVVKYKTKINATKASI